MKSFSAVLATLALFNLAPTLASPAAAITKAAVVAEAAAPAATPPIPKGNFKGTAISGALDSTKYVRTHKPTPVVDSVMTAIPGPDSMTFRITNLAGTGLHTYESPAQTTGTIDNGAVVENVHPKNYSGMIAFNSVRYPANVGAESLIEYSYTIQDYIDPNVYILDVDVSFVDGFSFPIMCYCGATGAYLSGCDKPLWSMTKCPDNNGQGSCKNPDRDNKALNVTPDPFFQPCQGLAYTYPNDHEANSNNECQSGVINCQVLPNGGLGRREFQA
ncbi:hypothetical protein B0T19DRAFT_445305 [Cercophora scortea]|uniref:Thaumatin-like protein n=1 Tax=Cercophora scortea TaxID=314031 RepID=A0AAE0I6P6_9PEZI|nr:hypothetical protein B0T19DRAFT_445305 [Cercophora scortea]